MGTKPLSNYVGTSWERAKLLVEMGWRTPLAASSAREAYLSALAAAREDGSHPVVLEQRALGDGRAEFRVVPLASLAERPEVAGLGETLTSILDATRDHLVNAINVGKGDDNAKVPTLSEIKDAHRRAVQGTKKLLYHVKRHLGLKAKRVPPLRSSKSVKAAPKAGKTARIGGTSPKAALKTVKADVTIRGEVNGKPATTKLRKGATYSLVKTSSGTTLRRKGGRSNFVVDSADLGKL